ncbi:MAG: DUF1049 domain-containing protein [Hyphomicrobiales bacterium]|nr:MAG: DUF1049 domain-containing protein [Hyphomicrobiales bacterium]
MKNLGLAIIIAPISLIVVVLAVANRHPVTLSLDPFATDTPALAVTVPVFWLFFATLALGIILGGVAVWLRQGKWRRAARRNRFAASRAEREAEALKEQVAPKTALPAPGSRKAA